MLSFLPAFIKAPLAALLFALNTVIGCLFLYPFALIRLVVRISFVQNFCSRIMVFIAENWISINSLTMKLTQKIEWKIDGLQNLERKKSYLVISNHQSWMDIVILQHVFNRKIPFIRFFLKHELIYVPFLGWAWWALDFPFMKRHSKAYLEKNPNKRNEDFESTQKACAVFKGKNVTVLNFLEGTRITKDKHSLTQSPFENLLLPKAGGLAFVLKAMGEQFDSILDVTIHYPKGPVTLWEAFEGKFPEVVVKIRRIEIPPKFLKGDYLNDPVYKVQLQNWLLEIWKTKDLILKNLKLV